MKIFLPSACYLVIVMATLVPRTYCTVVFSIEIDDCNLTFSQVAFTSFQECLCNDTALACTVLVGRASWVPHFYAHETLLSQMKDNTTAPYPAHFVCEATCRKRMFTKRLSWLQCKRQANVSQVRDCKNDAGCYFRLSPTDIGCSNNCVDITWANSDQIIVPMGEPVQLGSCQTISSSTTATSSTSINTSSQSREDSNSTLSETGSAAAASDGELISGSIFNLVYLAAIIGMIPFIIAIIIVLVRRRRSRSQRRSIYIQESRQNIYITPIDVMYSAHELSDRGAKSFDGGLGNGCRFSPSVKKSVDKEDTSKSYYTDIDLYNNVYGGSEARYVNCSAMHDVAVSNIDDMTVPTCNDTTVRTTNDLTESTTNDLTESTTNYLAVSATNCVDASATKDGAYSIIYEVDYSTIDDAPYSTIGDYENTTNM